MKAVSINDMKEIEEIERMFIPLDFNSLIKIDGQKLKLSNYYINYAFYSDKLKPLNGMEVVLYDKFWTQYPDEIICVNGVLEENIDKKESWSVVLNGRIYKHNQIPKRKYFISFIGADTYVLGDFQPTDQKNTRDFKSDKLANINCFTFAHGSELPDFSKIVGIDVSEISDFFKFSNIKIKPLTYRPDGQLTDDTLVVRGGGNRNEIN